MSTTEPKKPREKSSVVKLMFLYEYSGDSFPEEIHLADCSVPHVDGPSASGLITGIYGTVAKQLALEVVAAHNTRGRKPSRILMIDANYRLDSAEATREQIGEELLKESGWLNVDRLKPDVREKIRKFWLLMLEQAKGSKVMRAVEDEDLVTLVAQFPQLVPKVFEADSMIVGMLHPIKPKLDPKVTLQAATVRLDPKRFSKVEGRFVPTRVRID